MTWTVEVTKANPEQVTTHDLLVSYLAAQAYWRRLSKPARAAVALAWNLDTIVVAHPNTLRALYKHGFITYDERANGVLTAAGRAIARHCVKASAA